MSRVTTMARRFVQRRTRSVEKYGTNRKYLWVRTIVVSVRALVECHGRQRDGYTVDSNRRFLFPCSRSSLLAG